MIEVYKNGVLQNTLSEDEYDGIAWKIDQVSNGIAVGFVVREENGDLTAYVKAEEGEKEDE